MNNSSWKIPLSDISIDMQERDSVLKVMRSRWLTMGEVTKKFEKRFRQLHQVKHAFAVSSCTSALYIANLALGVKKGDEIIAPSLTFVATASAVLYAGAEIIFADITSCNNLNISPKEINDKINKKTKGIAVVHYAGYPCDMGEIMRIAKKNNLFVIEDSAHAPLVKYNGRYLGTYGDIGCFSFFSNKNMTTGEGGMVVTNNDMLASRIALLRSHGMTSLTLDRHKGHAFSYDVVDLGFNFRIDEMRSAIGLSQLEKLKNFNSKRRALVFYYIQKLNKIRGVELPFKGFKLAESACHIFPILLENKEQRDGLQRFLKDSGIQTSIHYPPVHAFSYYRKRYGRLSLPISENIAGRILTLPLFPSLRKSEIDYIVGKLKYFLSIIK